MFSILSESAKKLANNLVDYQNAVNIVSANAYQVTELEVPVVLVTLPEEARAKYDQVQEDLRDAKRNAANWKLNLVPRLQAVPQTVVNFDDEFQIAITNINAALQTLVNNPLNLTARIDLQRELNQLSRGIDLRIQAVTNLQADLNAYSSELATVGENITQALSFIYDIEGANADQLQMVQDTINHLRDEIKKYETILKLSISGTVIGGVLEIATFFAPPFNIVGLVIVSLSIVGDIQASVEIRRAEAQLRVAMAGLDALNTTLARIQNLGAGVDELVASNRAAQMAMSAVLETWNELAAGLQQVAQNVEAANSTMDFMQAQADIQAATTAWTASRELASQLAQITYNYDPTPNKLTN